MNFQFNLKKAIIITFIIALPLLSLNMQQTPHGTPLLLLPITNTVSFLHYTVSSFSEEIRDTTRLYLNLWDTNIKYKSLLKSHDFLKTKLSLFDEIQNENNRLRNLLEFKGRVPMKLLSSKVTGHDLVDSRNTLIINRGSLHGVKEGLAVISPKGAVGYIFRAHTLTSQILLLTDKYAVIDALEERSRSKGIIEGTNQDFCRLIYLNNPDEISLNDKILTSGLDDIFPKGIPIGTVTKITPKKYNTTSVIEVKPSITVQQLEEVFVVLR